MIEMVWENHLNCVKTNEYYQTQTSLTIVPNWWRLPLASAAATPVDMALSRTSKSPFLYYGLYTNTHESDVHFMLYAVEVIQENIYSVHMFCFLPWQGASSMCPVLED